MGALLCIGLFAVSFVFLASIGAAGGNRACRRALLAVVPGLALIVCGSGCIRTQAFLGGKPVIITDRFGNVSKIGEIEVKQGGDYIKIKGYESDQVTAIREAAKGAAEGVAAGFNPAK